MLCTLVSVYNQSVGGQRHVVYLGGQPVSTLVVYMLCTLVDNQSVPLTTSQFVLCTLVDNQSVYMLCTLVDNQSVYMPPLH